jgi:hypothetical protein
VSGHVDEYEYCLRKVQETKCTCNRTPQGCHYLWCAKELAWNKAEEEYEQLYEEPLDGLYDCLG